MLTLLFGIVLQGSRTIERQRRALEGRIGELSNLLAQNEELRRRIERASRHIAEMNEHYLRRISADLHDGPAQLLALASLRLDALKSLLPAMKRAGRGRDDLDVIRESLSEALGEIRDICAGLALPELDNLSPAALLGNAVRAHERRTGTSVATTIEGIPDDLPKSIKICLYRFVQEGLSNAFRHAGGAGQTVTCQYDGTVMKVTVSDTGPGFDPSEYLHNPAGLACPACGSGSKAWEARSIFFRPRGKEPAWSCVLG